MARGMETALAVHHMFEIYSLHCEVARHEQSGLTEFGAVWGQGDFNGQSRNLLKLRGLIGMHHGNGGGPGFVGGNDEPFDNRDPCQHTLAGRVFSQNQDGQTHCSFASQTRVLPPRQGK